MSKIKFIALLMIQVSFALVLEEKVEVGKFVELNSDATIWMRCEGSSSCMHNVKSGSLAKIVKFNSPKMTLQFQDGSRAWLKATADGFEGMYPTSYEDFPPEVSPEDDPELIAEMAAKKAKQDSIDVEIKKCKELKGPKFEGLGFGCKQSVVKSYLDQFKFRYTSLNDKRIGLIAYEIEKKVLNIQLVFNMNDRFSGVEYHFDNENQRKFRKVVIPQLKWMAKVFGKPMGKASETKPLKLRGLKEDNEKVYKVWDKKGYEVKVAFGKVDGNIGASGYIKNVDLYLERKGKDVLNLDPKVAQVSTDDSEFSDFDKKPEVNKAKGAAVGSTKPPEDFDDW